MNWLHEYAEKNPKYSNMVTIIDINVCLHQSKVSLMKKNPAQITMRVKITKCYLTHCHIDLITR